MSMFGELLAIKSFRESRAEVAVSRQRQALLKAQADEEAARTTLTEYQDYATRREATVYRELCSRVVQLRDIEDVQNIVAEMRKQKDAHEQELEAAGQKREQESGLLTEAQVLHKEAARMKQKFVELAQANADELFQEAERKEDLELEEVASLGRLKSEWDNDMEAA